MASEGVHMLVGHLGREFLEEVGVGFSENGRRSVMEVVRKVRNGCAGVHDPIEKTMTGNVALDQAIRRAQPRGGQW